MQPVNLTLISEVAAELAQYRDDDEQTFWDTLDGETDAGEILDRLLAEDAADLALIEATRAAEARMKARRDRIDMRHTARRAIMLKVLDAAGVKKAERGAGTVSARDGAVSVRITDEAEVPRQLCAIKEIITPDKKAIRAQIEAGVDVPGAILVRGDRSVTVRVS